jgi:hypothetical protein
LPGLRIFVCRHSFRLLPAFLLAAGITAANAQTLEDVAASRKVFAEAAAAREKGDVEEYLRLMREVVKLRPDQPGAQFRLAGALAKKGEADAATTILKRIAAQGLYFRLDPDPTLRIFAKR